MATNGTVKQAEGTQVMDALNTILERVDGVNTRLDNAGRMIGALKKEVDDLKAKPELKTRVVQQPTPAPAAPVVVQPLSQEPAPAGDGWAKQVTCSRCNMIGITKTRTLEHWKVNLYMPGFVRPATLVGFHGFQPLISLLKHVWPVACEDYFSDEKFKEANKGRVMPYEEMHDVVPFAVYWYRSKPNANGKTYVNVEGVAPYEDSK